ncbi:MAG: copper-containing nitrite reductase [Halobacteriales archaeon]|nr:copper-containing nitrite reductase [Halobacteriales archaeon]
MNEISRRKMVKILGATGATAAATGCLGGDGDASAQEDEPSDNDDGGGGGGSQQAQLDDPMTPDVETIAADPWDVPDPVDWDSPREHDIHMRTEEHVAEIEPGVTFRYMTFDGQVPGPMVRVREGDTVNLTFEVPDDLNVDVHNVDFHAVYGAGGGAEHTTIAPGETAKISFSPQYAGIHIYHCAVPNMDQHISAGMYGAILVEPRAGLPEVDHELYLGQNELYTNGDTGEEGHHQFDFESMANEDPTYVTFNGEAYGFTGEGKHGPIEGIEVGDTARVYLSCGGPNLMSSWHAIGNVWSKFYRDGSLLSEPDLNVETAPVGPGTVAAAEMEFPVPGPVKIVDHALSRVVRKGALAVIDVEGEPQPDIYNPDPDF